MHAYPTGPEAGQSSGPEPRRPLVAVGYWACQLAGWGLIVILDLTLALGSPPALFDSFLRLGLSTGLSGILVSHGWHAILKARKWLGQRGLRPFISIAAGIGLASVLQLFCVYCDFNLFLPDLVATGYGWIPSSLLIWLIVFSAWTFLYVGVLAYRRARQLVLDKLQLQLLVKDANLRALQAQINPHFFFNSLNSIRALIFEDQAAAADMVDRLAEMMRRSLTSQDTATIALEAEIAAVSNYLAIEKVRFEDRLQISIEMESGVGATRIPPMALQTLVENAIKYGVEDATQACAVTVTAVRTPEGVAVEVLNQGQLRKPPGSTRIGLHNTAQRLQLLFGHAASVALTERDGLGERAPSSPRFGGGCTVIRALLIDDERLARAELRRLLAAHPDVEIIGEAGSAAEALNLIHELAPDLLFLDVQMPGGTGFDLLASLEQAPSTIFTTAFDAHAVEAFEVNALDYLMKPIRPDRLLSALNRVRLALDNALLLDNQIALKRVPAPGKIFIKDGSRCWFVSPRDIFLLESEGNYTRVYFHDNKPLILRSLQRFEDTLDPRNFVRISRQYVVNVTHVVRTDLMPGGGMQIQLTSGTAIQVARRRVDRFKEVYLLVENESRQNAEERSS